MNTLQARAQTGSAGATVEFWTDQVVGSGGWMGYQQALDLWSAQHPEITVNMLPSWRGSTDRFIAQSLAGVGPDLVHVWDPNFQVLAGNHYLLDVGPLVARDAATFQPQAFYPRSFEILRVSGTQFAVPTWLATSGLFYNKALFAELGVRPPDDSWTWDTFLQAGPRFARQGSDGKMTRWLYGSDNFTLSQGVGPILWVWGAGGDVFDAERKRFTLGEPAARRGLEFWYSLFQNRIAYSPADHKETVVWDAFIKNGTLGIWDVPSWGVAGTAQDAQFDWDIGPEPKNPQTGQRGVYFRSNGIALTAGSRHPDEAWAFTQFWTSQDAQLIFAQVGFQHPTRPGAVEPYWNQQPGGRTLNLRQFAAQVATGKGFPHLDDPVLDRAFQQVLDEG